MRGFRFRKNSSVFSQSATASSDPRILKEQMVLSLQSLLAMILFDVPAIAAFGMVMANSSEQLGGILWSDVATAVAIQAFATLLALFLYIERKYLLADPAKLKQLLTGLHAVSGVCWGLCVWVFWRDGVLANNIQVSLGFVIASGMLGAMLSTHGSILWAGMIPAFTLFCARLCFADGRISTELLVFSPIWLLYLGIMGNTSCRRLETNLRVRFANEDMAEAYAHARDQAIVKQIEAEAANASKSAFLASMSHELRTPLNAILGFSEVIARKLFGDHHECYFSYAQDIHNSGQHLLSLINDLLDVAKIEAGKMGIDPRLLDPLALLKDARQQLEVLASAKAQRLRLDIAPNLPPLVADERAFRQIVINLVSNAVKYSPLRSTITIAGQAGENGSFVLCVEDDGPGIPVHMIDALFQPFKRVENRYSKQNEATGLGLSLVRGLAELHGGRAWIESAPGTGTKVFALFPAAVTAATTAA